jgi:hypothetical protein
MHDDFEYYERVARDRQNMFKTIREKEINGFQYDPRELSFSINIDLVRQTDNDRLYAMYCAETKTPVLFDRYIKTLDPVVRENKLKDEVWCYMADLKFSGAVKHVSCSFINILDDTGNDWIELDDSTVVFRGKSLKLRHGDFTQEKQLARLDNTLTCHEFRHFVADFEKKRRQQGLADPDHCFFEGLELCEKEGGYKIHWGS